MSTESKRVGKAIDTAKCLAPNEIGNKGAYYCLEHEYCLFKDPKTNL
jgi:hypothetical protein